MLKRAWYCLAIPWAVLMSWLAFSHGDDAPAGVWIVALGPLFVPAIMGVLLRFIVSGKLRRQRALPYRPVDGSRK